MTGPEAARGPKAVARFLRPRSVAIVGMSTRAGQRGPGHPAIAETQQVRRRHSSGRPQRRADRRPPGAQKRGGTAGGLDLAVFTLPPLLCAIGGDRRHFVARRQRRPEHPAIAQAQQVPGRHSSRRPQRGADRRPRRAEEPRGTAGGRRSCRLHAAGRGRARRHRGLREAQGRLGDGVCRGLCRSRRTGNAGRDRQDRARRRTRHRRPELPRRHQQRRRHDAAHAVRARGAAFRRGLEARPRLRRPERRHARPLPARRRRARHAAVLCHLDRQRDRP